VEVGETLQRALIREMKEETGLFVQPGELLTVFERIERAGRRIVYHYVIADYLCHYRSGSPRAGSDAEAVAFVTPEELPAYRLPARALEVVRDAFRRSARP
jgi:ADP-ribose pyrophosphatase YjhB (NUDIX family)